MIKPSVLPREARIHSGKPTHGSPASPAHASDLALKARVQLDSRAEDQTGKSDPPGTACLTQVLTQIASGLRVPPHQAYLRNIIHLHVLDPIDFDCSQPFLFAVLKGLIQNAINAVETPCSARIDVLVTQYKNRLYFQIADNGPGMPDGMAAWFDAGKTGKTGARRRAGSGRDRVRQLLTWAGGEFRLAHSCATGTRAACMSLSTPTS